MGDEVQSDALGSAIKRFVQKRKEIEHQLQSNAGPREGLWMERLMLFSQTKRKLERQTLFLGNND